MSATPYLTTENLTANDCRVLSAALGMQPTHSAEAFAQQHPDLATVWHALRHTTNVPVMIACAALRGRVVKVTPDPRLNPKPHPPLAHAPKKTPGTPAATPRRTPPPKPVWTNPAAVVVSVCPNPKKKGSSAHARFELYAPGRTVAELLAAGLQRADLSWDCPRGFVTFALPGEG